MKIKLIFVALVMFMFNLSFAADKDVVKDTNGNIIKNTFNNCVITKWDSDQGDCGVVKKTQSKKPVAKVAVQEQPKPARIKKERKSRSYIMFFGFDSANLTADAKEIIKVAYNKSSKYENARFNIVGHADLSGSREYNLALSKKRAEAVKSVLVGLGAESSKIKIDSKGESSPLVQTADGKIEPQNRRVEVNFYY